MSIPFLDRLLPKDVVGVDIGSRTTKFFRGSDQKGSVAAIYEGDISSLDEKELKPFREFLRAQGLQGVSVACSLGEDFFRTKKIELPKMPDYDLKEAVNWEMRDSFDGAPGDYAVRHLVLEEIVTGDARKLVILVFAVKTAVVKSLVQFLRKAGLKPEMVEPAPVSLVAAFDKVHGFAPDEKDQRYGVINFGESRSTFVAMNNGRLLFMRQLTAVSGLELKKYLSNALSATEQEMDAVVRQLVGETLPEDPAALFRDRLDDALSGYLTRVAVEVQRSMDAFSLNFRREKINELFLCGGGATLMGLKDHLIHNLAVTTSVLNTPTSADVAAPHLYNIAFGLSQSPL